MSETNIHYNGHMGIIQTNRGGRGGGGKKSYFAGKINAACYQIMKMRNFLLRVFQKTQRINIA